MFNKLRCGIADKTMINLFNRSYTTRARKILILKTRLFIIIPCKNNVDLYRTA